MAIGDRKGLDPERLREELKPRLLYQTCPTRNAALARTTAAVIGLADGGKKIDIGTQTMRQEKLFI
jgi:hypothetical protein